MNFRPRNISQNEKTLPLVVRNKPQPEKVNILEKKTTEIVENSGGGMAHV